MTKKSSKPYNDKKSTEVKNTPKKKNLDNTTKIRVEKVLNNEESLDTSFLEGRFSKKSSSSKERRERLLLEKSKKVKKLDFLKKIFYSLSIVCIIVLGITALVQNNSMTQKNKKDEIAENNKSTELDRNYLFIGDFHTDNYEFDEFQYDYHYVKVCDAGLTAKDVLEHLDEYIYRYNPSLVFLQFGVNDLTHGIYYQDVLDSFNAIIDGIQENRPFASIYVESLYPINASNPDFDDHLFGSITNQNIEFMNNELRKLCEKQEVTFVDTFSELSENGILKEDYSDDGIILNSKGYKKLNQTIHDVIRTKEDA